MRWLVDTQPDDVTHALRALSCLLACGAAPEDVTWRDHAETQGDWLEGTEAPAPAPPPEVRPLRAVHALPTGFIPLAETVLMHADASRFRRLHELARDLNTDPRHWHDTLDPRRLWLERAAREVRREIHKMHAFVRFRPIGEGDAVRHVAWFEPEHHIVRAATPFFAKRFAAMHWAILTPGLCAQWDRETLAFTPGVDRSHAPPPDAGEALWIDYYRSIFNPSRVKTDAMLREMPKRYWRNLPETQAISQMLQQAPERSARMVAQASASQRRLPIATALPPVRAPRSAQEQLDELGRRARHCSECPLSSAATQTVWGEGSVGARLMVVGEQPGDQEDLAGRPFVGPAGQLLRQAIEALGWPADQLYLTNAVKHFHFLPRGKRRLHKTPGQREADACLQWLEAELRLVAPQAVLALGGTAASSLLGRPVSVAQAGGRWWWREDGLPVWVVHHPAAVLRREVSGAPDFDAWVEAMRPALTMAVDTAVDTACAAAEANTLTVTEADTGVVEKQPGLLASSP